MKKITITLTLFIFSSLVLLADREFHTDITHPLLSRYYPDAADGVEFQNQVKEMLMAHAEAGVSVLNQYNRSREKKIRDDKRDWEAAMLPLLAAKLQTRKGPWQTVLTVINLRNSYDDPEIAKALQKLLVYFIDQVASSEADKKSAEYRGLWRRVHTLSLLLSSSGNPDLVNFVLKYAISEREEKLGLMDKFNYRAIMEGAEKCPQKVKQKNFAKMVKIMAQDDLRKDDFYRGLVKKAKAMEKSLEAMDELPVKKLNEKSPSE